jgi:hypothetical protein
MSDLERRIGQWRRRLAEEASCSADAIDELESHVREEVQQLVAAGRSEGDALEAALVRLGSPSALAAEFAKVAPAAAVWLPVRLATLAKVALAAGLVGFLLAKSQDGLVGLLLAAHLYTVILGYTATFFVGFLAACYAVTRPFRELSAGEMASLRRAVFVLAAVALVLTLIGVVLGSVWAKEHLGRFWDWDPRESWAALVLVWDAAVVALLWRRQLAEHTAVLLGLAGNVLVAFAWFGPLAATGPLAFALLLGFALTQLALLGLGLAPAGCLRRRGAA